MQRMLRSSHLGGTNAAYIEALYEAFLDEPNTVPDEWRSYFEQLPMVEGVIGPDTPHSAVINHFERLGKNRLKAKPEKVATSISTEHQADACAGPGLGLPPPRAQESRY